MKLTGLMVLGAAVALAGCSDSDTVAPYASATASSEAASEAATVSGDVITELTAAELPEGVTRVVRAAVPGMTIAEAQRKERDGRVYFDVEGKRSDGSEVELDVLEEAGAFKVVEIQRDIAWNTAPALVQAAAGKAIVPVRVIESAQPDGTIIYELFAEGKPAKPSLEVKWKDGKAEVLTQEWPH
ncbi:hypothetical protein [Asticcacaulis sp. AND118]|uniref:hypothetical protein n=1 Tax=Asticcacaulis sp. AND118 TaxID=2840468 RepID=UPI001CFFD05C|nr:hypothetical protein [Asticcacaulis sp. AND118]UDF02662.1 hypothetical protein LH365_09465 [Asticcacaulis sp. AND118]